MIHLEDTEVALAAVVGPRRFPCLFPLTLLTVPHLHELALERWGHAFLDSARVRECCPEMGENSKEAEAIESEAVEYTFAGQRHARNELFVNVQLLVPVKHIDSIADVLAKQYQA